MDYWDVLSTIGMAKGVVVRLVVLLMALTQHRWNQWIVHYCHCTATLWGSLVVKASGYVKKAGGSTPLVSPDQAFHHHVWKLLGAVGELNSASLEHQWCKVQILMGRHYTVGGNHGNQGVNHLEVTSEGSVSDVSQVDGGNPEMTLSSMVLPIIV